MYGNNDYAIRAGLLTWLVIGVSLKRGYEVAWRRILSLWLIMAVAGILMAVYNIGTWREVLVFVFTHSGLSFLYVLLLTFILPGRVKTGEFLYCFALAAAAFYGIGGIAQYIKGSPIVLNQNAAYYVFESYNYFVEEHRLVGLFEPSVHTTGLVLNIALAFMIAKVTMSRPKTVPAVSIAIVFIGILLTQTRANYMAMLMTLCLYLIFTGRHTTYAKFLAFFAVGLFVLVFVSPFDVASIVGGSRISDAQNVWSRMDIYKTAWLERGQLITDRFTGIGLMGILYYGDPLTAFAERASRGIGENQILDWIDTYGWVVTAIIVYCIARTVSKLYCFLRSVKDQVEDYWPGWALLFAWLTSFVVFTVNCESRYLSIFLFALSEIWLQEVQYTARALRGSHDGSE